MKQILARDGQSIYDLCLMSYGTLDNLIQFCLDNRISDVNAQPVSGQVFNYSSASIIDSNRPSNIYSTFYVA